MGIYSHYIYHYFSLHCSWSTQLMLLTEVITTIIQVTGTMVTMVTTIITTQEGKSYFFMIVYVNA